FHLFLVPAVGVMIAEHGHDRNPASSKIACEFLSLLRQSKLGKISAQSQNVGRTGDFFKQGLKSLRGLLMTVQFSAAPHPQAIRLSAHARLLPHRRIQDQSRPGCNLLRKTSCRDKPSFSE